MTFSEIAKQLGISTAAAIKIHNRALIKIMCLNPELKLYLENGEIK